MKYVLGKRDPFQEYKCSIGLKVCDDLETFSMNQMVSGETLKELTANLTFIWEVKILAKVFACYKAMQCSHDFKLGHQEIKIKHLFVAGDSGGPLIVYLPYKGELRAFTIGVVSRGSGCANFNQPGVFSKVSAHLDWIYSKAGGGKCPTKRRKPRRP